MVCTIARISGLSYHSTVDAIWETFWQYMSASIGLILTSVAAFRSLFVSHRRNHSPQDFSDLEALRRLYAKVKQALRRTFSMQHWGTRLWYSNDSDTSKDLEAHAGRDWGKIEHGTITGLRSFIREYQRPPATESEIMSSYTREGVGHYTGTFPLRDNTVASSCRYDDIASIDGSGQHERILAQKDKHREDKIPFSKESRRYDKMLTRGGTETQDKLLAIDGSAKCEAPIINKPANVRNDRYRSGDDSVFATSDFHFGTGSR